MARMTGLAPAFTQTFMGELSRKRQMQEQQLEQQRQQVELQSMFKSMGFEAPPGMTQQTAPMYLDELQTRRAQTQRTTQIKDAATAEATKKAQTKAAAEEKKRATFEADRDAFISYAKWDKFAVNTPEALAYAKQEWERETAAEDWKKEQELLQTGRKELVDYRQQPQETLSPRPYTDAQLQWVEQQLKQMTFTGNIEEVMSNPVIQGVLDAIELYDKKKYAELSILYNTAVIMQNQPKTMN